MTNNDGEYKNLYYYKHGSGRDRKNKLLDQIRKTDTKGITAKELYAKGKSIFGKNKRYLHECLKELVSEKMILREETSYKNVIYTAKFPDEELRQKFLTMEKYMDEFFPKVLEDIRVTSNYLIKNKKEQENIKFFESIIYGELAKFLEANIETIRLEDETWKEYFQYWIIKYHVRFFEVILGECFKSNGLALRQAYQNIHQTLTKLTKNNISPVGSAPVK